MANIITGLGPVQNFSRSIRGAQIAPRDRLPESFEDYIGNSTDPLVGFLEYLWDSVTGQRSANAATNANSLNLQKEMIFQREERELQNEHDEEMYNKYQSPEALFNAYRGIGVSAAGAASAILGNSPAVATANNAPSPSAPGASIANPSGLSAMASIIPAILQAPLWDAQAKKANEETFWIPIKNQADLDKVYQDIEFIGFQMDLSTQELDIAKSLARSSIDLNDSQIERNFAEIDRILADTNKIFGEIQSIYAGIDFTKAQTRTEYLKGIWYRTESDVNVQDIHESVAREHNYDAQTDLLKTQNLTEEQRVRIEELNAQLLQLTADMSQMDSFDTRLLNNPYQLFYFITGGTNRAIQAARRSINAGKFKSKHTSSMRSH